MNGKDNKHLQLFQNSKLMASETVHSHIDGAVAEVSRMTSKPDVVKVIHFGQLILTNRRICFCRNGIFGEVFETIPLDKITSVETSSRFGWHVLRCHTSHDELAFQSTEQKNLFDAFCENLEQSRHPISSVSSESNKVGSNSIVDEISRLLEMKSQGVLSEDEFNVLKCRVING